MYHIPHLRELGLERGDILPAALLQLPQPPLHLQQLLQGCISFLQATERRLALLGWAGELATYPCPSILGFPSISPHPGMILGWAGELATYPLSKYPGIPKYMYLPHLIGMYSFLRVQLFTCVYDPRMEVHRYLGIPRCISNSGVH